MPESQFKIPGFGPPFQEDRNQFDGGIVVLIKEDIPANFMFVEKTPSETIYLFKCAHNPKISTISNDLEVNV